MKRPGSQRLIPLVADLHIHSTLSPCGGDRMVPRELIPRIFSFDLGVEVFSITDHNAGSNCGPFATAAQSRKVLFIPGIELQSSEEIHLLGYFPDLASLDGFCTQVVGKGLMRGLRNDPERFGHQHLLDGSGKVIGEEEAMLSMPLTLTLEELVGRIHDHRGIAVAAHLDRAFSVISQLGFIPPQLELDAVEVREVSKVNDIRAKYLKGRELNILSSSDSHHLDMIPKPKMKLWVERADVASCLACIKGEAGRITLRQAKLKARTGPASSDRSSGVPWS